MKKWILILSSCLWVHNLIAQEIKIIDYSTAIYNKKALVILNGFGDSKKNRKVQSNFFKDKGYDLFIPEYHENSSLDSTISNFSSFYELNNLDHYKEVNFLCYIVGGFVLNKHIIKYGHGKISTIIYDRSPIQERAPLTTVKKIPLIVKILYGKLIFEFSKEEIVSLNNSYNIKIGVIIENKATRVMRIFKKTANSFGEYNYDAREIEKNYSDFMHTKLDHDQMYNRFDIIGDEIFYFLNNGIFTKEARREKYNWNPFKKIKNL